MLKDQWLNQLPKAELHCHLDGSLSVATIQKLAKNAGVMIPSSEAELRNMLQVEEQCPSLKEYLTKFDLPIRCLQNKENLRLAAYDLLRDVAAEQVRYLEVRFAPMFSTQEGLTIPEVIESVIAGLREGTRDFGVEASAILCCMRHLPAEQNVQMIKEARAYMGCGVCAVDLAGGEADFPPMVQKAAFEAAKNFQIPFTIHAGECRNAQNVADAIALGAIRIGHGIAMKEQEDLMQLCASHGIGIEMCPSSNLQTKAVDGWADYPLPFFMKKGIKVSINTDNRTVTGTTMTRELERVQKQFALTRKDIKQLMQNAVDTAFASDELKHQLTAELKAYRESVNMN